MDDHGFITTSRSGARGRRDRRSGACRRPPRGERRHGETTSRVTPSSSQRATSSALVDRAAEADLEAAASRPYSAQQLARARRSGRRADSKSCAHPDPAVAGTRRSAQRGAALAADQDRRPRLLHGLGLERDARRSRKNSPSCATSGSVQSRLHTSIASSTRRPRVAKSSPTATPLLLEPAGADAELDAPARDDVERLHRARRDERVAQPEVVHVRAEAHVARSGRRGSRGTRTRRTPAWSGGTGGCSRPGAASGSSAR